MQPWTAFLTVLVVVLSSLSMGCSGLIRSGLDEAQEVLVQKGKEKAQCIACENWYELDALPEESEEAEEPAEVEDRELEPVMS